MSTSALHDATIRRAVLETFREADGPITTATLYAEVARRTRLPTDLLSQRAQIGKSGQQHNLAQRTARWAQQSLKRAGLITRCGDTRGLWQLTEQGKHTLHHIRPGHALVAFSTALGCAIWGDIRSALRGLGEPVTLFIGSPPFPITKPRAYGGPTREQWVDFVCTAVEAVLPHLATGGSVALDIGTDLFVQNSPERELLPERLAIALHDRCGLSKIDRVIWHNPSRPPSPIQWASKTRQQLNCAYDDVLVFSNNAKLSLARNTRVLKPHTDKHLRLIAQGGERVARSNSDGAYCVKQGAYANPTAGAIPRNVFVAGHRCPSQDAYKAAARRLGLAVHGAPYPVKLAKFLIEWLSAPGDLIVDGFAGSVSSGVAAEQTGRRWIAVDTVADYLRGGAERFEDVWVNPLLDQLFGLDQPNLFNTAPRLAQA